MFPALGNIGKKYQVSMYMYISYARSYARSGRQILLHADMLYDTSRVVTPSIAYLTASASLFAVPRSEQRALPFVRAADVPCHIKASVWALVCVCPINRAHYHFGLTDNIT